VRGGLDDALDKLARRDELRRRAAGEATGTAPAVQELAEAIAAVVGRNPKLAVTVGVEGAGDPVLLHFAVEDGVVQVNVDNSVAARVAEADPLSPRHADFDLEVEESDAHPSEAGQETRRISYDDRDRYDPGTGYTIPAYGDDPSTTATPGYPANPRYADPETADQRFERHRRHDDDHLSPDLFPQRNGGGSARESAFPTSDGGPFPTPHPFAVTPPPPVPPQSPRRVHAEQHRAPEEPTTAPRAARQQSPAQQPHQQQPGYQERGPLERGHQERGPLERGHQERGPLERGPLERGPLERGPLERGHQERGHQERGHQQPSHQQPGHQQPGHQQPGQAAPRGMPTPLPKPIPLKLDSEETELAAKRLSALLRDNPSLLRQSPPD